MSNLHEIMAKIKTIFDISEDKISSLNVMLKNIEVNRINDRFNRTASESKINSFDMFTKTNLLNAITELILENPSMNSISSTERKDVLKLLFETNSTIYEELMRSDDLYTLEKMSIVVMYSMLSYLADKQTISNIMIDGFNEDILSFNEELATLEVIEQLEFSTFYSVILMLSNIKNYDSLSYLNINLDKADRLLKDAQEIELKREHFDIKNGLKIGAFGNIVYLIRILKEYLFTGKVESVANQDIYTLIDMHSYNAFHLLNNEEIELKLIGHLLKYAFTQVAENSIWNIADKSPKIYANKEVKDLKKKVELANKLWG